jgi:capsular polysaccharide biosynthesis protein
MKSRREMAPYDEDPRARQGGAPQPNTIRRMPAVSPEQTFFHFDFPRALQMHRGLALGIFVTALLLSVAFMARRWNNYKAESLVYVQPSPPRLLESAPGEQQWPYDANTYESYIQQQIHNVTREDVLAGAVRRIDGFKGEGENEQAAAGRLGGNLEVARVSTGYQISITATAGSAAEAAQMANAVAVSFIESATREQRSGDTQRLELLRDERDRVLTELVSDRSEQEALNKQLGVASVGSSTPDTYDDQIAAIRAELVKARTDNDQAAAKLTAMTGGPSSAALDAEADEIVAADPGLVSMKTALNKRRSDLISQMANLTPSHPLYKQDTEELAKINTSLDAMTKDLRAKAAAQIEQKLKNDLERTAGVEARLNGQLAQMTGAAGSATPRLQRASDLATDIARLQARFTTVDEQFRNLSMENAAPGAVYLSAPAIAPLHADRKKVYRNGLLVLLAGIVFALAAALIAHNLDPRVYVAADVERVLGFAPMALLPDLYEVGTDVAEEYMLRLAAAVEHAHQQDNLRSCIFTAVAPGAGTTTVSKRVSSMLQAMGRETVLVDTVGAPQQDDVRPGSDLIHLPRGSRSSALLQQMAEEANEETIVMTDTAPLLVSGETEYLARFVDSAIVIIESGVTTRAQLREVAQTLERLNVAAVGFVLNRISLEKANPAFRQSVSAVEKHLKAQTWMFDRQHVPKESPAEEPAAQTPARPSVFERLWQAVSEPVGAEPSGFLGAEPRKETSPAEQTVVSPPQKAAASPVRDTEAGPEAHLADAARTASADDSCLSSYRRRPEEAMERNPRWFDKEAPEPAAQAYYGRSRPNIATDQELLDSVRKSAEFDATETLVEPARMPPEAAPGYGAAAIAGEDATIVPGPAKFGEPRSESGLSGPSVPARPARGREVVQVVLGGRGSASLTGEAVPDAWRARLRSETEDASLAQPPAESEAAVAGGPERGGVSSRRRMPFAEINEGGAGSQPLKEWWDELVSPVERPTEDEAHAVPGMSAQDAASSPGQPDAERDENRAASRLSGLRNLLVSLGVQNLHHGAELRKVDTLSEPRVERLPERAVYAQLVGPNENSDSSLAPMEVTARPEIIPPQFNPEAVERAMEPKTPKPPVKPPHINRWDSPDDVEILPSRRGQYRRRH